MTIEPPGEFASHLRSDRDDPGRTPGQACGLDGQATRDYARGSIAPGEDRPRAKSRGRDLEDPGGRTVEPRPAAALQGESEIQWDDARAFLRRRLATRLRGVDPGEIEDLTQEAMIRLLRAVRREGARSLEALMTTIAERTRNDFLKKWMNRGKRDQPIEEFEPLLAEPSGDASAALQALEDDPGRVAFLILQLVGRIQPSALPLLEAKMRGKSLEEVAREQRRTALAVRKEWSRVAQKLRDYASAHPEAFGDLGLSAGGR